MTYYFLSFHSSVIFYCFSCLNRRLKVNLRYYSIDLLFKLSKSDSANLDKFVLLRTARLKFDEETSVFSQFQLWICSNASTWNYSIFNDGCFVGKDLYIN